MNFLNFLLTLQLFFLLGFPFAANSQPTKNNPTNTPKPIINKIVSLPVGHFSNFNSIVTANSHTILLQSSNLLWIYDGINWESIAYPEKPIFTENNEGNLYLSYGKTVESISFSNSGFIRRETVVNPNEVGGTDNISSIKVNEDEELYFTSSNNLWHYTNTIEKIDSSNHWIRLMGNSKNIFYTKDNHKLYPIANTEANSTEQNHLAASLSNQTIDIVTLSGIQYAVNEGFPWIQSLNKTKSIPLRLNSNTQIKKVKVKKGILYLLTNSNQLLIINSQESDHHTIDLNAHPSIDNIIDFYPYSNSSILILTPTEVYSFPCTSVAGVYSGLCSAQGKPITTVENNGIIYYGTTDGIFAASYNGSPSTLEFRPIENINQQVTGLYNSTFGCFASTTNGVYKLENLKAKLLVKTPWLNTNGLSFAEFNDRVWIVATNDSVIYTQPIAPKVSKATMLNLPNSTQKVRGLKVYGDNLIIQSDNDTWHINRLNGSDANWQKIDTQRIKFGQILFTTDHQSKPFVWQNGSLYAFDINNIELGKLLVSDSTGSLFPLLSSDSTLTVLRTVTPFSNISTILRYRWKKDKHQLPDASPIATIPTNETIKQSVSLSDSILLIVSNTGLHYYLNTHIEISPPTVSIAKAVLLNSDNSAYLRSSYINNTETGSGPTLSPHLRNIRVTFGTNLSGKWETSSSNAQFSSFLKDYDKSWTHWTASNIREINRLSPGVYTLMVKSKNFWGIESEAASITFTIRPYFYETPYFVISFILLGCIALYAFYKWRRYLHAKDRFKLETLINNRTEELVREKEKTDNLLARVLPKETASELKEKGRVNTQRFQVVTVLFCDIEGFTRITDETNPEALIDQLDKFFLHFDSVVERYRIEKIKTIGDAYMCAGGIPQKNRTNPVEVVLAALEMIQHMKNIMYQSQSEQNIWEIRIGIDTGPVIAGVVGRNKLSYDIWGSTVNTASRMESSGIAGQINISGNTYMLVRDYFECTYRGNMPVKNKGDIQMYFVKGIKPKLSVDMNGIVPNNEFFILLQLIRLGDLEDFVLEKLEKGLPQKLYYHNLKHTVDVYTQVELIGRAENVNNEELLLLRTAALFHDAGHLIDYDTHEEMAVKLVHEILPEYYYSERQIEIISDLIMSTKLPPKPKNLLEEIICDADLDYLGRTDFIPVSNMLYRELHEHGKIGTLREWNEMQIKFIAKHSYFTKTARKLRNVNKKSQLDKLRKWMEEN